MCTSHELKSITAGMRRASVLEKLPVRTGESSNDQPSAVLTVVNVILIHVDDERPHLEHRPSVEDDAVIRAALDPFVPMEASHDFVELFSSHLDVIGQNGFENFAWCHTSTTARE